MYSEFSIGVLLGYFRQFCLLLLIMSSKRQWNVKLADQQSYICKITAT